MSLVCSNIGDISSSIQDKFDDPGDSQGIYVDEILVTGYAFRAFLTLTVCYSSPEVQLHIDGVLVFVLLVHQVNN